MPLPNFRATCSSPDCWQLEVTAEAFQQFVAKWQAREPEMAVAEVFCPRDARARFQAWGGLLHELRETLFELSDPRVTGIKAGWWAEELLGLGAGRSRHPLTEVLAGVDAPWSTLGRELLDASVQDVRPGSTAEAIDSLFPLAGSTVAVESALFESPAGDAPTRALAVHWLLARLPSGLASADRARIPMRLIARHGWVPGQAMVREQDALLRDWVSELLPYLPIRPEGALFRRTRTAFDRARLEQFAVGKGDAPAPRLATLWRAWRAARAD